MLLGLRAWNNFLLTLESNSDALQLPSNVFGFFQMNFLQLSALTFFFQKWFLRCYISVNFYFHLQFWCNRAKLDLLQEVPNRNATDIFSTVLSYLESFLSFSSTWNKAVFHYCLFLFELTLSGIQVMPLYRNESVPHQFHWEIQKVWIEAVDRFFHFHLCVMKSPE